MALARDSWRRRKALTEFDRLGAGVARYVDLGVEIRGVERDDKAGDYPVPGQEGRYRVTQTVTRGGMFDSLLKLYISKSVNPKIWHCSPKQLEIILHESDESGVLLYGAEGAGKTKVLGMWAVLRAIDSQHIGKHGGMTAPTAERLKEIRVAVREAIRDNVWAKWHAKDGEYVFATGCVLKFRSVKKYSEDLGSPIQGYTWAFCGSDEIQDYADLIDADIEARGRGAPGGRYLRLATATAKDSTRWRNFRDQKKASPDWAFRRLDCYSNVFVPRAHWDRMERNMSKREADRRLRALDVAPELALYPDWRREVHLRALESLPLRDVTDKALSRFESYIQSSARFAALIGHDPGKIFQTSEFLRCFVPLRTVVLSRDPYAKIVKGVPVWALVGELQTKQKTPGQHARLLQELLQQDFELELEPDPDDPDSAPDKSLVLCDPHGESNTKTDQGVYMAFQRRRFDIMSAALGKKIIHKDARISMLRRLMLSSRGIVRLLVDLADGQPVAPKFVESVENLEKDHAGEAENVAKNEKDVTHPSVAVGYALFPLEQEKFTDYTKAAAMDSGPPGVHW